MSSIPELLGLPLADARALLERALEETGEPRYRLDQVRAWVYERRARSFEEMTVVPKPLRARLAERVSLTPLAPAFEARSRDGTVKHLWGLDDGEQVESVLIPTRDRLTLCLSSQVGCALACRFCATGYFGFRRQLRAAEIVAQYRDSSHRAAALMDRPITNVVYMGMGEPLANLEAVVASLEVLNEGFGFGARRITVSTVGLVPGIRRLAELPGQYELAVSLHAPEHELRLELMLVERAHPLPELFRALRDYQARKRRRLSFEYTLIHKVNDDARLADLLADLAHGLDAFVNLIPFNPIPDRPEWRASDRARVRAFERRLHDRGLGAAVRRPRGRDIAAACGQLRLERLGATDAGERAAAARGRAIGGPAPSSPSPGSR